jgi:predicted phosphodiesterase
MTSKTQTLRFLILSDTHGHDFFDDLEGEPHWVQGDMPKADVVLHCGDLTNRGSIPDNAAAISMLSAFNAELKLVIAGNHDISLDKDASTGPEMLQTHRKVIGMWTGHRAKAAGIHYLTEGFRK